MNEIHSIRFTPFYVHERGNSEHDTRQNHSPRRFVRRGSLTHIYIYMIYHPMFTRRVYIFLLVYIVVPKTYCILFGNYAKHTSCLLRVLCKSTSGTFGYCVSIVEPISAYQSFVKVRRLKSYTTQHTKFMLRSSFALC